MSQADLDQYVALVVAKFEEMYVLTSYHGTSTDLDAGRSRTHLWWQQLVCTLNSLFTGSILTLQSGLLIYDHAITLSDEIRYVWKRKASGATVIFVLNRYISLLYQLFMTIQLFTWASESEDAADKVCTFDPGRTMELNRVLIELDVRAE